MSQWGFHQLYARIPEKLLLLKVKLRNLFYFMACYASLGALVQCSKNLDFACIKYLKLTAEEIHQLYIKL